MSKGGHIGGKGLSQGTNPIISSVTQNEIAKENMNKSENGGNKGAELSIRITPINKIVNT